MKKPQFLKQKIMIRVLIALTPAGLIGIYCFGWRVAATVAVPVFFCFMTEWEMSSIRNGKAGSAVLVAFPRIISSMTNLLN